MNGPFPVFRLGTRGSRLALWQAHHVAQALEKAHAGLSVEVVVIRTRGDRILDTPLPQIGGKGLFTAELEAALRQGTIHAAVHSLKDLPTEALEGLTLGAILERGPVHDVLVPRDGGSLETLPPGATVGTSSRRRAAQLLHRRPDLRVRDIRGNVDTRIRKVLDPDGPYAATVLAQAGLQRLGLGRDTWAPLPLEVMLPAPGQGALAVQCRDVPWARELLAAIDHPPTRAAVDAERAFLAELGGGVRCRWLPWPRWWTGHCICRGGSWPETGASASMWRPRVRWGLRWTWGALWPNRPWPREPGSGCTPWRGRPGDPTDRAAGQSLCPRSLCPRRWYLVRWSTGSVP